MTSSVAGRDFPTNGGGLCHKGWTSAELLSSPDATHRPAHARGHKDTPLREVDWDTALDFVAERFRELRETRGADAVGSLGGGGLTNEKAYLLGKFARVALRTSKIDYNGRFCMSSAAAAGMRAFGLDRGLPFPLTDIAARRCRRADRAATSRRRCRRSCATSPRNGPPAAA